MTSPLSYQRGRRFQDTKPLPMSVFVLDKYPVNSASYLTDSHIRCMPVHLAQLLTHTIRTKLTAKYLEQRRADLTDFNLRRQAYAEVRSLVNAHTMDLVPAPAKIQCSWLGWMKQSAYYYQWVYKYWRAVCDEYFDRFGKVPAAYNVLRGRRYDYSSLRGLGLHFTVEPVVDYMITSSTVGGIDWGRIPSTLDLSHPESTPPDERKILDHRISYMTFKVSGATWTNRGMPAWVKNYLSLLGDYTPSTSLNKNLKVVHGAPTYTVSGRSREGIFNNPFFRDDRIAPAHIVNPEVTF